MFKNRNIIDRLKLISRRKLQIKIKIKIVIFLFLFLFGPVHPFQWEKDRSGLGQKISTNNFYKLLQIEKITYFINFLIEKNYRKFYENLINVLLN